MRGRKPKPTRQRKLEGNAGRRPLNKTEPEPAEIVDASQAPGELVGNARAIAEWQRLVPMLRDLRMVTEADRGALIAVCLEWARYIEATLKVSILGMVVKTPAGYPIPNPYLSIATKALAGCHRLWPELGLTPSSRSRVTTIAEPADPFAEFDDPAAHSDPKGQLH